jgi:REP element-mobilizing transposase RayT
LDDIWQDDLFSYIGGTVKEHKSRLLVAGGVEDHVHLLLKIHPSFAISKTVQLLKSNSSRWIKENYQKNKRFEWQTGYGAFSVSQSQFQSVANYIQNQKEHHKRLDFKQEYIALLNKHGIEFDLNYVFDEEIVA